MPDDNQSTTNPSVADSSTGAAGTASADTNAGMDGLENINIPSLEDLEYATPSAYIDPNLQTTEEKPEETPAEEEKQPEKDVLTMTPEQIAEMIRASNAVMLQVAEKITTSRNILIALSGDPSVDELSAAISLSLFLDRLGKHAIAIYSGTIPDALKFLNPEDKFESDADVLQDFVISIDKDKADHLRYKLDGDDVRIFITPYRHKIVTEDLEFSRGDYNVDLVLALNVNNGVDLDPALREYGRIMKDAFIVNITTGNAGKFAELEWTNRHASSVSEMVAGLFLSSTGETQLNADEATTLLTGIVAATDRFARANTFPETMQVASKLLDFGADQQLVASNITDDMDNQFFSYTDSKARKAREDAAAATPAADLDNPTFTFEGPNSETSPELDEGTETPLSIAHSDEDLSTSDDSLSSSEPASSDSESLSDSDSASDSESSDSTNSSESEEPVAPAESDDSESAESTGGVTIAAPEGITLETPSAESSTPENSALLDELKATEASLSSVGAEAAPDLSGQPVQLDTMSDTSAPSIASPDEPGKYGQMLADALAEPASGSSASMDNILPPAANPAASVAPEVPSTPELNAMPEINYGQTSDEQVLPPPPAPPVDLNASLPADIPTPNIPDVSSTPSAGASTTPDASAFTIPGM